MRVQCVCRLCEKQSEHSPSLFSLWGAPRFLCGVLLVFSVLCCFGVDVCIVTQGSGEGRSNENKEETLQEIKSKLGRILSTDPKGSLDHLLVLKTCTTFSVSFQFSGRGSPFIAQVGLAWAGLELTIFRCLKSSASPNPQFLPYKAFGVGGGCLL